MSDLTWIHVLLSGTGLTVIAGTIKYVIDAVRGRAQANAPLSVATASATVMKSAMDALAGVNDDLNEEISRIRALLLDSEVRRLAERQAYEEREKHLKAKIEELETRVRDLDLYVASLSADIKAFRESEFPPDW